MMAVNREEDVRYNSLKLALYETLNSILSSVTEIRIAAEEQIKALEVTEEFGVQLAELTVYPQRCLAIRQLSSVLLKQYVESHWSSTSEKFRPPETSDSAKAAIRQLLPIGLKESISKVRSSVAYAISAIAHWDWPEKWPELFDILMSLTNCSPDAVHGAMRVLTEFSRELTGAQMPAVAPVILPEMYRIFMEVQKYSIRTRGRAVEIFCTCSSIIGSMSDYDKTAVDTFLVPILPTFTSALVQSLQDMDPLHTDSGLKTEVLKALTILVTHFPKQMVTWLPMILTPVWNTLTDSTAIYVSTVVNGSDEANEDVDSDGEVLGFENVVFSIFEFVHGLVETPKFRSTVRKGMQDLLYYVVLYMQITEEQINTWSANPDQFVEDEDDETFSYSVRISAQDLLQALAQEFKKEVAVGVACAVTKHLQEAEVAKNSGSQHWWKIHESCLLVIGCLKDLIMEQVQDGGLQFNIPEILESVVLSDLNLPASPFLLGRCLWTASRYTRAMNTDLIQRFLQATASGLNDSQSHVVRVSAAKSVWGFCGHLKDTHNAALLVPYLAPILDGLLSLSHQHSTEVLSLVLETTRIVVSVDKAFTASVESKVAPLAIAVFLKYHSDPEISLLAQEIFKELSKNEACQQPLQQRLLPTLVSILNAPLDKIPTGLQTVALDVLQTVVRSSSVPLSSVMVSQAFPATARCILRTDDNSAMQSGGECIRAFVSVAVDQIAQWHDDQNHSGLWYAVQVVLQLLNPRCSEYTAVFVGRLVTCIIIKAGSHLGESLDLILKAVLSKMQQAKTLTVIQSLVLIFGYLVHTRMDAVLEFLSSVPGPTGKSALEFVLTEWCSKHYLFNGYFDRKVSSIALCKLMLHGVTTKDARLMDIVVKGDQVFHPDEGIRTRSQTKIYPAQWTVIPLLVKICKLMINELANVMEVSINPAKDDDDLSDSDGWDEDEEYDEWGDGMTGSTAAATEQSNLSFMVQNSGLYDNDDDDEDPDVTKDPLYNVDLRMYLTEFLQSFSQQHCYAEFSAHFSLQETKVLSAIGITR